MVGLAVLGSLLGSLSLFWTVATVSGESMAPTLKNQQRVLVTKEPKKLKRGDLIAINIPSMADKTFVKRIVGLPGDSIYASGGVLYVNGRAVKKDYATQKTPTFNLLTSTGQKTVPDKKLFVLGDNRQHSTDSRTFGFVDYDDITGQVGV